MSKALDGFDDRVSRAQQLWIARDDARTEIVEQRRQARLGMTARDRAEAIAAGLIELERALVESALVAVVSAWEVFLHELLEEYLDRNPVAFRRAWKLRGRLTYVDFDSVLEMHRRPFQELGRAKAVLCRYLGDDLFQVASNPPSIDLNPVETALALRHAVVHNGGRATKETRKRLATKRAAHAYLLTRPGPKGAVPATQFERILTSVITAAHTLDARAWSRRPRLP